MLAIGNWCFVLYGWSSVFHIFFLLLFVIHCLAAEKNVLLHFCKSAKGEISLHSTSVQPEEFQKNQNIGNF